jgi:5-methylcytosine-specific restriction enzyme A
MLISGDSGGRYGYVDEWTDDGLFLYTGEGQRGPMRFVAGNKSIRDHQKTKKTLHLFEQDRKDKRMLLYLGEMEYVDHQIRPAPDIDKKVRDAIIFELRPVGSLSPDSPSVEAALAAEMGSANKRTGFGSPENNRRVEQAAIAAVRSTYEKDGWEVQSVEAEKVGYDLRCRKAGLEEHVEVKGIQGSDICFILWSSNQSRIGLHSKQSNMQRVTRCQKLSS